MKHKKTFIAGLIGTFLVLLGCATPIWGTVRKMRIYNVKEIY